MAFVQKPQILELLNQISGINNVKKKLAAKSTQGVHGRVLPNALSEGLETLY